MTLRAEAAARARDLIVARLGLDLSSMGEADLARLLERNARGAALPTSEALLARLAELPSDSTEWQRIAAELTVGETYFFRDAGAFRALEQNMLPALIAARRADGTQRLRLWSAACASGEEPYSLAMLLDQLLPDREQWRVTILGTDLNSDALRCARRGRYREWSFRQTPPPLRERYFRSRQDGVWEIDPAIRAMVSFATLNLASDAYPSVLTNTTGVDLILCRNVLMYLRPPVQLEVLERLQRALVPGGWLCVSPAEAASERLRPLVPVHFDDAIAFRKATSETGAAAESPPASSGWPPPVAATAPLQSFSAAPPRPPARAADAAPAEPAPAEMLARGQALADAGCLEEARRLCETALARDRLNLGAYLLHASICQELGALEPALISLRRAVYLAPDSAAAHFLMGALLIRGRDLRRGRRDLQNALELLERLPKDAPVEGAAGLTAGRLLEVGLGYLRDAR
jgi:chemotaxis protein methyltransferase CheR